MSNEIDSLLRVDAQGIILYLDGQAMPAQLEEWLRTPENSVWGWPSYGNPMRQFKHEPTNENTAVIIENYLIDKVDTDIPDLTLMGVRCNPVKSDMFQILFFHQNGIYEVYMQGESQ